MQMIVAVLALASVAVGQVFYYDTFSRELPNTDAYNQAIASDPGYSTHPGTSQPGCLTLCSKDPSCMTAYTLDLPGNTPATCQIFYNSVPAAAFSYSSADNSAYSAVYYKRTSPTTVVPNTPTDDSYYSSSNPTRAGTCAGTPQAVGVVRTDSTISTHYSACVSGSLNAYDCCNYQAMGSSAPYTGAAPASGATDACAVQYFKNIATCNATGDSAFCYATAFSASDYETCCGYAYYVLPSGTEGPSCAQAAGYHNHTLSRSRMAMKVRH